MASADPVAPREAPRRAGLFAACLVLLCPAIGAAQASTDEILVSDQMCSGLFLIPLEWTSKDGETHELLALFDTGASSAFVDPDAIERISGKRLEAGTRAVMEHVSVAGMEFSTFRPRVRELDHLGQALGRRFDVFLPFQAFERFLLTLDYGRNEVRVSRGSLPRPDKVEIFSSRGRDSRPWIKTRVGSRNRKLLLDSGSNGTISVRPHRSIRWAGDAKKIRLSQGMSDLRLNEVGRYDGVLRIGSIDFEEPMVGLTEGTELVGYDVLRHFVLTFDQSTRRVRMQPLTPRVRMTSRRGTGALFRPRENTLELVRTVPGSPAEAAGLQPGDQLTHLDGTAINDRGCRDMQQPTGTVEYTFLRNATEYRMTVENAVLVE